MRAASAGLINHNGSFDASSVRGEEGRVPWLRAPEREASGPTSVAHRRASPSAPWCHPRRPRAPVRRIPRAPRGRYGIGAVSSAGGVYGVVPVRAATSHRSSRSRRWNSAANLSAPHLIARCCAYRSKAVSTSSSSVCMGYVSASRHPELQSVAPTDGRKQTAGETVEGRRPADPRDLGPEKGRLSRRCSRRPVGVAPVTRSSEDCGSSSDRCRTPEEASRARARWLSQARELPPSSTCSSRTGERRGASASVPRSGRSRVREPSRWNRCPHQRPRRPARSRSPSRPGRRSGTSPCPWRARAP